MKSRGESYNLLTDKIPKRGTNLVRVFFNCNRIRRYKKLLKEANEAQIAYELADDRLNKYTDYILRAYKNPESAKTRCRTK